MSMSKNYISSSPAFSGDGPQASTDGTTRDGGGLSGGLLKEGERDEVNPAAAAALPAARPRSLPIQRAAHTLGLELRLALRSCARPARLSSARCMTTSRSRIESSTVIRSDITSQYVTARAEIWQSWRVNVSLRATKLSSSMKLTEGGVSPIDGSSKAVDGTPLELPPCPDWWWWLSLSFGAFKRECWAQPPVGP